MVRPELAFSTLQPAAIDDKHTLTLQGMATRVGLHLKRRYYEHAGLHWVWWESKKMHFYHAVTYTIYIAARGTVHCDGITVDRASSDGVQSRRGARDIHVSTCEDVACVR